MTTTILSTNLADSGAEISIVLVNVNAVQPDGLSTTTCIVTTGGFTYTIQESYVNMILAVQNATIGT